MIEYFIVFGNQFKSQLFELIWQEKKNQFCAEHDVTGITFKDVYAKVWTPTITSCKDLLHKLHDTSFTYSDIKNFAGITYINNEVIALYNAMHQCFYPLISSLQEPKHWVPQAVKNIKRYVAFASHTEPVTVVQLCLNFKNILRLKGEFSAVNDLESLVSRIKCAR